MRRRHDPIRLLVFALRSGDERLGDLLIAALRSDATLSRRAWLATAGLERLAMPSRQAPARVIGALFDQLGLAQKGS